MVIFAVRLQVFRQLIDTRSEKRDLHFGGAGIAFVSLML